MEERYVSGNYVWGVGGVRKISHFEKVRVCGRDAWAIYMSDDSEFPEYISFKVVENHEHLYDIVKCRECSKEFYKFNQYYLKWHMMQEHDNWDIGNYKKYYEDSRVIKVIYERVFFYPENVRDGINWKGEGIDIEDIEF